jgi:hypothetical protein
LKEERRRVREKHGLGSEGNFMADVHNAGSVEEDMEDVSEKTKGLLLNHLTMKFLQAKGPFQGIPTN